MKSRIRIGTSTCGLAAGADAVVTAAHNYVHRHLLPVPQAQFIKDGAQVRLDRMLRNNQFFGDFPVG